MKLAIQVQIEELLQGRFRATSARRDHDIVPDLPPQPDPDSKHAWTGVMVVQRKGQRAMSRGCKQLIVQSACGAILLVVFALSSVAGQRGGSASGGGGGDDISIGRGAAGMDRNPPGQEQPSPPASNPAVKAKLDHDQNIKDAARLAQLANEVKQDLENSGESTLSVASLKKSEEMAKLSKKLHDRMKANYASAPKSSRVGDATSRLSPKQ